MPIAPIADCFGLAAQSVYFISLPEVKAVGESRALAVNSTIESIVTAAGSVIFGAERYAVCEKSGDDVIVLETTVEDLPGLAAELTRRFSPRGSVLIYSRAPVPGVKCREIYYGHIIACAGADERVSSLYVNPLTL